MCTSKQAASAQVTQQDTYTCRQALPTTPLEGGLRGSGWEAPAPSSRALSHSAPRNHGRSVRAAPAVACKAVLGNLALSSSRYRRVHGLAIKGPSQERVVRYLA
jgi:hypothetical protein